MSRGFLVGHPGRGLVDQKQARFLGKQHADLKPLLLAMRQFGGLPPAVILEPHAFQQGVDALALVAGAA